MAVDSIGSALLRKIIGRRFTELRTRAKLTQEEAARRLDRGRATIGRIEDGDPRVRFRVTDVEAMLTLYDASEQDREVLLALTTETRNGARKSWWHDYTDTELPGWFVVYVSMEDSAWSILQFEPENVPGLLQAPEYAANVVRLTETDATEVERRVKVRTGRQSLLTRPRAPKLEVILNEAVLHRIAGCGPVAPEQLKHLLHVSQFTNVDLRVLPYSAGFHGGMAASSGFSLLEFPVDPMTGEPVESPLAYVDGPTGAMYLGKKAETDVYRKTIWRDLSAKALDPEATRAVITAILEGLPQ